VEFFAGAAPLTMKLAPRSVWNTAANVGALTQSCAQANLGTRAVPADHRPQLENFQCVRYSRSHTIEPRKHQAVHIAERQSLRGFAPQHVELMSKDKDLGFQRSPRPEQSDQGPPDQPAKIAHREQSAYSRSRSAVLGLR
jgi:hypothetical protein